MAAQFDLYEYHGTNLNSSSLFTSETAYRSTDTSDSYINHPIAIPDSHGAINRSCETVVRAVCTQAPDNAVVNFKIWRSYTLDDGISYYVGSTDAVFTPSNNDSVYATYICDGSQGNNLANAWDWDRQTTITKALETTRYLVMQIDVTASGVNGAYSGISHFVYDES